MANKTRKINKNKNVKKAENNNTAIVSGNELKNLLKIVLIICGVLLVFYFITILVQNKGNNSDNSDTNAVIQYNKILVGEILNRKENEYYVLVEKENDPYIDLYKQYLTSIQEVTYFTVDLSEVFNQNSIGENTVVEGNEIANYKFSGTTLLKVINGSLSGVYKTKNEIIEHLKNL